MKPSAYPDANIFSILHYRGSITVLLAQRSATREWWKFERRYFKIVSSPFMKEELRAGNYPGQEKAITEYRRSRILLDSHEVRACALTYINAGVIPESARGDAFHLAFATIHAVDYLLTWNQAHLLNPVAQKKLHLINDKNGWRAPEIVSPLTIPSVRMGQAIRRSKI